VLPPKNLPNNIEIEPVPVLSACWVTMRSPLAGEFFAERHYYVQPAGVQINSCALFREFSRIDGG